MKPRSFGERLDEKSAQALFANHLRERYNYNPAMADRRLRPISAKAIFRDVLFARFAGSDCQGRHSMRSQEAECRTET